MKETFEHITKKHFIELLKNNESVFLCSYMNLCNENSVTKLMNLLFNYEESNSNKRKCVRMQSNGIQFSNGSWLYFNDIKQCYIHNDVIISYYEHYDSFDEIFKYDILAYQIIV